MTKNRGRGGKPDRRTKDPIKTPREAPEWEVKDREVAPKEEITKNKKKEYSKK